MAVGGGGFVPGEPSSGQASKREEGETLTRGCHLQFSVLSGKEGFIFVSQGQYLVKWRRYSGLEATWVAKEDITEDLVR